MKLTRELRTKIARALRAEPPENQLRGLLVSRRDNPDGTTKLCHCTQGLICHILGFKLQEIDGRLQYVNPETDEMLMSVADLTHTFGLTSPEQLRLDYDVFGDGKRRSFSIPYLNDSAKLTFTQIADLIEYQWPTVAETDTLCLTQ